MPARAVRGGTGATCKCSTGRTLKVEKVDENDMAISGINGQCPTCLYREIPRLRSLENAVDVARGAPVHVRVEA